MKCNEYCVYNHMIHHERVEKVPGYSRNRIRTHRPRTDQLRNC